MYPDPTQKTETAADRLRREPELRKALKADPNNAEAHLQLGRIYIEKGNWTAAAAEARAARSNDTRNDEADALLARPYTCRVNTTSCSDRSSRVDVKPRPNP